MIFDRMERQGHERVLFVQDRQAGLNAIIAIHSTRLGAALGGVRRWHYASEEDAIRDVMRLSEAMTYKAAVAHLPMGGGKSVIMLNAARAEPREAAARAMGRAVDTLQGAYIAAEDVGVNEQYIDWMAEETRFVMGGETKSRGGDPSPHTARGVVNGMKAAMRYRGEEPTFRNKVIAIQGIGSVGWNIAKILINEGANVKAADVSPERLDQAKQKLGVEVVNIDHILTSECDILCPCALGGVISGTNLGDLQAPIVCGAANNVLDDQFEDSAALHGRGVLYCPDFVVNAGGLIHLAGMWLDYTPDQLARKIADIEATTLEVLSQGEMVGSNHAAAVSYAKRVIDSGVTEGRAEGEVHAG